MKKQNKKQELNIKLIDTLANLSIFGLLRVIRIVFIRRKEFKAGRKVSKEETRELRIRNKGIRAQKKMGIINEDVINSALKYEAN